MSDAAENRSDEPTKIEVTSNFVRKRNALAVQANFGELYLDFYIHLMDNKIKLEPAHDSLLKDALAGVTLHACSRPWNEASAWTFHFTDPPLNLFVTGDNNAGIVTGRVFTEDIKESEHNLLFSQVTRDRDPSRRSIVQFEGKDIFKIIEQYYVQSEQRPARLFRLGSEEFLLLAAQPDCDTDWFDALDEDTAGALAETEELGFLEKREYAFRCGCSLDRIYPILASMSGESLDVLFECDEFANATCPRCGARYRVSKEHVEAFAAEQDNENKLA